MTLRNPLTGALLPDPPGGWSRPALSEAELFFAYRATPPASSPEAMTDLERRQRQLAAATLIHEARLAAAQDSGPRPSPAPSDVSPGPTGSSAAVLAGEPSRPRRAA